MPTSELTSDPLLERAPVHEGYPVLGGVVLYQKLGQGGMGAVYRGKHLRLEVDVALKIMATPPGLHPDHAANYLQRFLREAKTSASVKHANLIRVYDVDSEAGVHFLIMDFIDGESAGDRLKRKGRLSEQEAVEIARGAAEGLAAAHESGVVHRDVKPDNILIDKKGNTVVADLGLAKAFGGESDSTLSMGLSLTQQAMGTPYYMAPEQTRSAKDVGPQADVWSLGVTLYQMVTDELPWQDTDIADLIHRIRSDPAPDVRAQCGGLSDGLCGIIKKALSKDPDERYVNCGAMAEALTDHLDATSTSRKSVLPDAEAGQTKMALVTLTPPPSRTLTLIGKTLLRPSDSERLLVPGPVKAPPTALGRGGTPGWVVPAVIAGALIVIALIVGLTWALSRGSSPSAAVPVAQAEPDPLEAEAGEFYESQLEGMTAERFAEVIASIDSTEGRYGKTTYGLRISQLRERATAKVAEAGAREEEARRQAAFEEAVAAADEAGPAGDLEEAVRQLKLALEAHDDEAVRGRLADLEGRMKLDRLLTEAATHEKVGEWERAKARYEEALEVADDESREAIQEKLAEVEKRIETEKAVAAIRREADAGNWREARSLVQGARASGIADVRLADLSRRVAKGLAPPATLTGPLAMELVLVSGGTFSMGSDTGKRTERPVHEVTLDAFYVSRFEVTRAQFDAFRRGQREVAAAASRLPAAGVSWQDAGAFCGFLSGLDERRAVYRLPTEAEWERAARGPQGRAYPWGDDAPGPRHANIAGRSDGHAGPAPVGSYPDGATPLGIFDLAGNVAEWCADWYGRYPSEPMANPGGPASGKARVLRGGAFALDGSRLRGAARGGRSPGNPGDFIGFRVVRELTAEERLFLQESQ